MMMRVFFILNLLLLHQVNGATVRKTPAFATPVYSDSYLPASMQVIFYAVEQLKAIQQEEAEMTTTTNPPTTMAHEPGQHQPVPSTEKPPPSPEASVAETESPETSEKPTTGAVEHDKPSELGTVTAVNNVEKPEMDQETPETNYGTPETNHETPEAVHEAVEANEEQEDEGEPSATDKLESSTTESAESSEESSEEKEKKQPSIDSVVEEIYGIMKPQNKSDDSSEESKESEEDSDEVSDENRFTLLGEKVTQVPRPSLSTYLKRSKVAPKCSVQQLALLYDALSKDARKQGFAKFSGYSDEILKTLRSFADDGLGLQLQKLLEKIVERKEVTRDESKSRIVATLTDLRDPGSQLNNDLRPLLPLRFNP